MAVNRGRFTLATERAVVAALILAAIVTAAWGAQPDRGWAERVVVIVCDGLRPDSVTPQYTPTLYSLARQGVFFRNHHAVFPSSTEVNGTAIATGVYPRRSGIIANTDYRPELSFLGSNATENLDNIRRGDLLTGGRYLLAPTLPEILQKAGMPTITAGTKPVVVLHDRTARRGSNVQAESPVVFAGKAIPKSLIEDLEKAGCGKFPTALSSASGTAAAATGTYAMSGAANATTAATAASTTLSIEKDAWTTKAVIKGLWKSGVPRYTLLWLYDPDATQHSDGVGSDKALAAIANVDKQLHEVLDALQDKKLLETTDVLVTSDHGFSNIVRGPDIVESLKRAKFKAVRKFEDPEPGEILVVGLGGAAAFYVVDSDEATVSGLVEFLQGADFTGVIFSRLAMEGTFPLDAAHLDAPNVKPDVVISMRWCDRTDEREVRGLLYADMGTAGKGTHGSLSRYDMHNVLVAAGPDFKKGAVIDVPSGTTDIAPTVLWILGVKPPQPLDGRVLREALAAIAEEPVRVRTRTLEASRDLGWLRWRQYLKISEVGQTVYLDEGNGGVTPE